MRYGAFCKKRSILQFTLTVCKQRMSTIKEVAEDCQTEIVAQLNDVLEQKGVKQEVLKNAQDIATVACQHLLDPENKAALMEFKGVPEDKKFELQLIYDFLKCSGFNFTANCLKYESQRPEMLGAYNRRQFGKECHLCTYDRTPYLVQLCREIQRQEGQN